MMFEDTMTDHFERTDIDQYKKNTDNQKVNSTPGRIVVQPSMQYEFPDAHVHGIEQPRTVGVRFILQI